MRRKWKNSTWATAALGLFIAAVPLLSLVGGGGNTKSKTPKRIPIQPVAGTGQGSTIRPEVAPAPVGSTYAVLAYNDLGMHCMNPSFAEFCLLPPYNTLHATVIKRGSEPDIITSGTNIKVSYAVPGNTESASKTDFWQYALRLFGVQLPINFGLTNHGLSGVMTPMTSDDRWEVTGIPITDKMDGSTAANPIINPFPIAKVQVQDKKTNAVLAWTKAVVPVSTEIACNTCHTPAPGQTVESAILASHDRMHGTNLINSKPVLCASCHADPALGAPGKTGISNMSLAMHRAHAPRVANIKAAGQNTCYSCHPGNRTQCQRDIHSARGLSCTNCHGDEYAVGNPLRRPWVDEPKCGSCHKQRKPSFDFEQPGKLFRDSRGHGGVACAACHNSPHAITPTVTAPDNEQAILLQGSAGVIRDCKICHKTTPGEPFFHKIDD